MRRLSEHLAGATTLSLAAVRRVVPNLFDADPGPVREFYVSVFEFDVAMDMGWIVTLA